MNGFVVEGNVIIYIFYVWVWMKNEEMMVGGLFLHFDGNKNDVSIKNLGCAMIFIPPRAGLDL